MLKRDDVDEVVNACDAGREGELIFAWTYEKAGAKKPVRRLWLSSMTSKAIKEAFAALRPGAGVRAARAGRPLALGGRLDRRHERDARGDDPAALARSTAPSRWGGCRRRRWRSSRAARRRSGRSCPSRTGSWTRLRAGRGEAKPLTSGARQSAGGTPAASTRAPTRGWRRPRRPPRSSRRSAAGPARSPSSRRRRARSRRRFSTTSRRCSARPTRASASRRGARWRPRSGSTRSTRRSPTRARARASCRAT